MSMEKLYSFDLWLIGAPMQFILSMPQLMGKPWPDGLAQLGSGFSELQARPKPPKSHHFGLAWLGLFWPGSAWLGLARGLKPGWG